MAVKRSHPAKTMQQPTATVKKNLFDILSLYADAASDFLCVYPFHHSTKLFADLFELAVVVFVV